MCSCCQEWRRRHAEYKEPSKRKALAAKKLEDAKKTMEEEKKKLMEAGDEDAAKALEEKFAQDTAPVEVNFDDLDVFAVEDVMDLGNCMPLFANFVYEDWTLLTLRAELHLLLHSFKKDLDDPDRPGFVEAHLAYYYQKYFKKSWNFGQYGLAKFTDLLDIMKDALTVDSTSNFLQAMCTSDCIRFSVRAGGGLYFWLPSARESCSLKCSLKAVQAEDVGLETFLKYTEASL